MEKLNIHRRPFKTVDITLGYTTDNNIKHTCNTITITNNLLNQCEDFDDLIDVLAVLMMKPLVKIVEKDDLH